MVGIIITGHGHFATGLGSSLKLIAGITDHVELVDFEENDTIEILSDNLGKALDKLGDCDGVLVLSDLAGDSPFKTSVECKYARPSQAIEVVAGTNLSMAIEGATMTAAYDDPLEMANALMETGKEYIVRFELEEHKDEAEEDGI